MSIIWETKLFSFYQAIVIKPSNIRIWIHDKDIPKLTKVLWEGQGMRLRTETSNNPKVKRFLDSVPYVMVINQINYKKKLHFSNNNYILHVELNKTNSYSMYK